MYEYFQHILEALSHHVLKLSLRRSRWLLVKIESMAEGKKSIPALAFFFFYPVSRLSPTAAEEPLLLFFY